jgi:hypothetical protein
MTRTKNVLCAGFLLWLAAGRGQSLRDDLIKQFPLTQVASDGTVLKAGAVMVLQKDGLLTYGCNAPLPALNTWKNGKLSVGVGRALTVGMAMKNQGATDLPMRKFVTNESFWIIGAAVEKDQMVFRLLSDPIAGTLYCADLKFPFPKNNAPPIDQAVQQIAEVLTLRPDKPAETDTAAAAPVRRPKPKPPVPASETAESTAAAAPAMAPIPPPAPPVESKTVGLEDTPEKVISALGEPKNIVNLGAKQIYVYPNLKVTFENGKVIDVQ